QPSALAGRQLSGHRRLLDHRMRMVRREAESALQAGGAPAPLMSRVVGRARLLPSLLLRLGRSLALPTFETKLERSLSPEGIGVIRMHIRRTGSDMQFRLVGKDHDR